MKNIAPLLLTLVLLVACDNSKWETIKGEGINDDPKSVEKVIYFENENNGLVGGSKWVVDKKAKTADGLVAVPLLFITSDGGKHWREIKFSPSYSTAVENACLHGDTLICQLDTTVLRSTDKGKNLYPITDSLEKTKIKALHFAANRYDIEKYDFTFRGKKYRIKERYQNNFATVLVCYGEKGLTDYYFVSFDRGRTWKYLQETTGDNKARYLLEGKFLYCYDFLFGLRRLKLR